MRLWPDTLQRKHGNFHNSPPPARTEGRHDRDSVYDYRSDLNAFIRRCGTVFLQ